MANPYYVDFVVPEDSAGIEYPANSCTFYKAGDIIKMPKADRAVCAKLVQEESDNLAKCFPAYCLSDDGFPTDGHRVPVLVAAGATVVQPVASIEGCRPPNMVCFHYCGSCLYVGYDADPVIDPNDPVAMAGGGADPNPTCRDLIENGVCIETLHIHNPSESDVTVMLSYYC